MNQDKGDTDFQFLIAIKNRNDYRVVASADRFDTAWKMADIYSENAKTTAVVISVIPRPQQVLSEPALVPTKTSQLNIDASNPNAITVTSMSTTEAETAHSDPRMSLTLDDMKLSTD